MRGIGLLLVLTACGTTTDGGGKADSDDSLGLDLLPPTNAAPLQSWLEKGGYDAWPAEAEIHRSAGPHFGDVRTFFEPSLDDSLAEGATSHPVGASAVKELYGSGTELIGWAVMRKTAAEGEGDAWYWYEIKDDAELANGNGEAVCVACHSASDADHVLSDPLPR